MNSISKDIYSEIWLALELMDSTLFDLRETLKVFNENIIAYICREILKGISWIHKNNRVHRDIKLENILYNFNGDIKISDFGVSTQLTIERELMATIVGTPTYMAPEIIEGNGYDFKVDIWAIGVIAYDMAEGEAPIEGNNKMEILAKISNLPPPRLKNPSIWSNEFNEFIEISFDKNPRQRATAIQLLEHPFLNKASKEMFIESIQESKKTKA